MIWNTHGVMGTGSRPFDRRHHDKPVLKKRKMALNLKGNSLSNRFLGFVMPKKEYGEEGGHLNKMMDEMAEEYHKLQDVGIKWGSDVWHVVVIGILGDLQFLTRAGMFFRSFNHVAKRTGQNVKQGICHLCLGGEGAYVWEDFTSNPSWLPSLGASDPWHSEPRLVTLMHKDPHFKAKNFNVDLWHSFHLGAGRAYIASSVVEWLPFLPGMDSSNMFSVSCSSSPVLPCESSCANP